MNDDFEKHDDFTTRRLNDWEAVAAGKIPLDVFRQRYGSAAVSEMRRIDEIVNECTIRINEISAVAHFFHH